MFYNLNGRKIDLLHTNFSTNDMLLTLKSLINREAWINEEDRKSTLPAVVEGREEPSICYLFCGPIYLLVPNLRAVKLPCHWLRIGISVVPSYGRCNRNIKRPYPRMVLSIWIGGNFLGIIDLAEVIKLRVFFQYFWSMGCNSTNEGLGPHKTHKVTSWTNSHVTNRKGTFWK